MIEDIQKNYSKSKMVMSILYIYLVVYTLNIYNVSLLMPLMIIPFIIYRFFVSKMTLNFILNSGILFLFSASFLVISQVYFSEYSTVNGMFVILAPFTMFSYGYFSSHKMDIKYILQLIVIITSFLMIFGLLSYFNTVATFGSIENSRIFFGGRRYLLNVWDGTVLAATGINTYFSLSLSLLPIMFISLKKENHLLKYKIIFFLNFIISLYITADLGNRTGFAIAIGSVVVYFIYNSTSIKNVLITTITIIILCIIGYILYAENIYGIQVFIENSLLFNRFIESGVDTGRSEAWKTMLMNIHRYPMGGREIKIDLNYIHNLWLDVAYDTGIVPFSLILIFTFSSIKNLVLFIRNKNNPLFMKNIFLLLMYSFFFIFFLEPIMQGWVLYFSIFCFFSGVLMKLNEDSFNG